MLIAPSLPMNVYHKNGKVCRSLMLDPHPGIFGGNAHRGTR